MEGESGVIVSMFQMSTDVVVGGECGSYVGLMWVLCGSYVGLMWVLCGSYVGGSYVSGSYVR